MSKNQLKALPKHIHMVGIKGTGMSSLAVNLKKMGYVLTGSDSAESYFTDAILTKNKIAVRSPFSPSNIPTDTELVITSTAYDSKNIELQEAVKRSIPIQTYPEILGFFSRNLKSIAVCGSHGKTTTSGLLAFNVSRSVYKPFVMVGSIVPQLSSYHEKKPNIFIFEADEYQNKLAYYYPSGAILTNIDYDHPDYFKNKKIYSDTFKKFIQKMKKNAILVYCSDDPEIQKIIKFAKCQKISFGFSNKSDYQIEPISTKSNESVFEVKYQHIVTRFKSRLMGKHNMLNATAVIALSRHLKIADKTSQYSIAHFLGTKRRLELLKKTKINKKDILIFDDFAHHPTEIQSTLQALKASYPDKKIWTVFQPHTFSRTRALFDKFASAFKDSDYTILMDIYGSKREKSGTVRSTDLVKAMKTKQGQVFYAKSQDQAKEIIEKRLDSDSIIVTMGATEIWRLSNIL